MPGTFKENVESEPPGFIQMWGGDPANIPAGWVICDGNNGTPNLVGKYARSINSGDSSSGGTGGSNSITLSEGQLPAHNHSGSASTDGSHRHKMSYMGNALENADGTDAVIDWAGGGSTTTSSDGAHSHTFDSGATGSGSSIANEPLYQSMLFIMHL